MHWTRFFVLLLLVSAPLHAGNVIARAYSSFIHDLAYSVTSTQRDMLGVELESKHVTYDDQPVTFQYQLWRLRKDSVCAQLKHNLLEYSKCTRAARALFTETCRHLTNNSSDHWKHQKQKNLYCAASVEFKPVVAEVRQSTAADDQELKRRQQCSVLRIQAMSSRDPRTIQMRDEVCGG
ncbi:hypothetical protein [Pontibacterium sp.]|uniref:hypothetical protein n=1 Tax=Pontibacterium sp. TaxID=2036026 RepID=UPI0035163CA7